MFPKCANSIVAALMVAVLSACSGDQVAFDAAPPTAASGAAPVALDTAAARGDGAAGAGADAVLASIPAVLQPQQQVSESERVAEQLRLVDYEQSYSIEMNRRAQEQAERTQRAAIAAQAGVVQGPGCEGTEGHAAVECERSLI